LLSAALLAAAVIGGPLRAQGLDEFDNLNQKIEALYSEGKTAEGRCQSKILNTCSGHRTAQVDPEKCRKINGREIRF
jgi:hypothetical protein